MALRRRPGFALVMCLMLSALLLVLALAFLGQRGSYSASAQGQRLAIQAENLAQAGLDDFRAKLAKDLRFAPRTSPDDPEYVYSEDLPVDYGGGSAGHFVVRVVHSFQGPPYWVYRVWCTGVVGPRDGPLGHRTIYVEIDTCPFDRNNPAQPNLKRFQILQQVEGTDQG